jgi:hypothetical protein
MLHAALRTALSARFGWFISGEAAHGMEDGTVPGAPTEVAVEVGLDLLGREHFGAGAEQPPHVHDPPRTAEATLRAVARGQSRLHWVEARLLGPDALHCPHAASVHRAERAEASVHREERIFASLGIFGANDDGARATATLSTANLGTL